MSITDIWETMDRFRNSFEQYRVDFVACYLGMAQNRQQSTTEQAIHVVSFERQCYTAKLDTFGPRLCNEQFLRDYNSLPTKYGPEYEPFFEKYGSHFMESVTLGG